MSKIKVPITITLEMSHEDYGSMSKNRKAAACLRRWFKDVIKNDNSFTPLFVEKDENGSWFEDCAKLERVTVQ